MGSKITIVRRDRTVRWYTVIDSEGRKYRWKMHNNGIGAIHFTDEDHGQMSPQLWGPMAIRGWLLVNGFTPSGSTSPEWAKQMSARREVQKLVA